ncbi:hypothetical protein CYY_006755 [Polysphondylium violaceum]|uniref:Uncharacterized protein n=1 Tax=Polysphondylium violaceum TaxID=133409 RepID=A0A8J4UY26_9MYCE|nr:hypothetical protein CYY_006755 [Polysphondylium violaceum]
MNYRFANIVLSLCLFIVGTHSLKPVLLMHGFALSTTAGTYHDWNHYVSWLNQSNPDQIIYDVNQLIQGIIANNDNFSQGFHIVAHSQGALLMRSVIEMYGLNVDTFVSLAGVHNGIYGLGPLDQYPWLENLTDFELTEIFYTPTMQQGFSVANWWNCAVSRDRYLENNVFLPMINQEIENNTIANYKTNFLASIKGSLHAFGSPQDGIVTPWNSELFGFFDDQLFMKSMNETYSYINDSYGLRTLDSQGKLFLYQIDNVKHAEWLSRQDLFEQYVLPLISK